MNQIFFDNLEVAGLNNVPDFYDYKRYVHLKQIIQRMSREARSVDMIDRVLKVIFFIEDV